MELTKEMSLAFIQMEIENAKDAPEVMKEMLKVIEESIKDDKITYEEFTNTLAQYFSEIVPEGANTLEERVKYTEMMCQKMIDKYGRKEI